MQSCLDHCIEERIHQLEKFCHILTESKTKDQSPTNITIDKAISQFEFATEIFKIESKKNRVNKEGEKFIRIVEERIDRTEKNYIKIIQSLNEEDCQTGSLWMSQIEQGMVEKILI